MNTREIQAQILDDESPIRVQGLLKKRKETLIQFIVKFLTKWNHEHDTIYIEDSEVQTEAGCRRSLGDIFLICRYYYPKTTVRQVADILYKELPKNELIPNYRSSYCQTINKRTFYWEEEEDSPLIANKEYKDEFGYKWSEYVS